MTDQQPETPKPGETPILALAAASLGVEVKS